MTNTQLSHPFRWFLALFVPVLLTVLVAGCSLLDDEDDADNGSGTGANTGTATGPAPQANLSNARVIESVFSSRITEDQRATGLISNVFPNGISEMHAVLVLANVEPGMEIVGRWYQLNVDNAPPEGREITQSQIVLDEGQVVEGTARLALNLDGSGRFLPPGAWLLRIFEGRSLIRTMSFYVLADPGAAPTAAPTSEAEPTATPAQ